MKENTKGILFAISAYLLWGILPIFWKELKEVNSFVILSHRVLWAFVFFTLINFKNYKTIIKTFKNKKDLKLILLASFFIGGNWTLFVWAVNHNKIVEASLGYYINPLFSIILGLIFFKEKFTKSQYLAFFLAIIGVLILTINYRRIPWVALILATFFAIYGVLKKLIKARSIISLNIETLLLLPLTFFIMISNYNRTGEIILNKSSYLSILLILGGILTAIPIYLFTQAARRIDLSHLGFIQYISPSMNLFLAIFLYKEPFSIIHLISFGFIWLALGIFTISKLKKSNINV